jgi:hypothetical protein
MIIFHILSTNKLTFLFSFARVIALLGIFSLRQFSPVKFVALRYMTVYHDEFEYGSLAFLALIAAGSLILRSAARDTLGMQSWSRRNLIGAPS